MEQLIQALASAAQTAAGVTGEQLGVSLPSLFEQPEDSAVGDLALPCFRLAKALRKSPAVIAADLAETIVLPDGVARAEAVNGYPMLTNFEEMRTKVLTPAYDRLIAGSYGGADCAADIHSGLEALLPQGL